MVNVFLKKSSISWILVGVSEYKTPACHLYYIYNNLFNVFYIMHTRLVFFYELNYYVTRHLNTHVTIDSNIFVLFLGSLSPSGKYNHVFAPGRLSAIIAPGRRARAKWRHCTKKMAERSEIAEVSLYSLAK